MTTQIYLTPKDQGRALSLAEFESADAQEGYRYELIDGKLEVSPLPNLPHDFLKEWLGNALRDYTRQRPDIINHTQSPARVFVPERPGVTAPEPDLAAYRDFPLDADVGRINWQDFSPVLVAEVTSPDDPNKDLVRNAELYRQVPSIREYWVVDPRPNPNEPSLHVFRRRGRAWQRRHCAYGDTYTTRLLPGFRLVIDPRQPPR